MTGEVATASLSEDGFIELTFLRENITLDVMEVKNGWEKAALLSPDKRAMVLLRTGKWTLLEREARDFVMKELKTWKAVAVVVDNLSQRIMGQVVISMTGRGDHIKLFDHEAKARKWLKGKTSRRNLRSEG